MTISVSEPVVSFLDTTCRTLTTLLARLASLAPGDERTAAVVEVVQSLCGQDEAFAAWCQSAHSAACASLRSPEDTNATDSLLALAETFPQSLLGDRHGGLGWHSAENAESATQLRAVAGLVVRLQALESSFASELHKQKTEAIYHFAYGLSHELNNPLANIATRAGVLAQQSNQTAESRALLNTIVDNAMRGCEMLGDLMLIARPPQLTLAAVSVEPFTTELVRHARTWATCRQITLVVETDSCSDVRIDANAFREALWSLLRNAIEAMPAGGEVLLRVRQREAVCRGTPCVSFEISDRGQGLSPQALEHCFDPYYSGREAGRGLGVGLAKAQRIVELHGGELTLYNRPGGGCTAVILLPC